MLGVVRRGRCGSQQHRSVEVREEDDHPIVWRQPIVLTMEAAIASSGAVSLARALGCLRQVMEEARLRRH
jgi:hypothetical protein